MFAQDRRVQGLVTGRKAMMPTSPPAVKALAKEWPARALRIGATADPLHPFLFIFPSR